MKDEAELAGQPCIGPSHGNDQWSRPH